MDCFIGTSGYSYKHWKNGVFYPKELPQRKWFQYYLDHFNAVELNVTFYRLPKKETFQEWNKKAAKGFYFSVKGSRFITHIKRLRDADEPLENFEEHIAPLKNKIRCILWQLPPNFQRNDQRLKSFLKEIRNKKVLKNFGHVMELRHKSWFHEDIYEILKRDNICLCLADPMIKHFSKKMITAHFLYLRFHGRSSRYSSNYTYSMLRTWAKRIKPITSKKTEVYAFFNNDVGGYAPKNAKTFQKLLEN